jgi:hypothetical protein
MTTLRKTLIEAIKDHGHAVDHTHDAQNTIRVQETGTKHGVVYREWVTLPVNVQAVSDWLGY